MKILEKYKDLAKYTYVVLRQYPKSEKYTIAADTRQALWEIGKNLKRAGIVNNKAVKKRLIEQVDEQRFILDFLIEMAVELQFVNIEKFGIFCSKSAEVGRMIGGWLKWASAS
jgi:ssDNA-specific exonuclease RecJ